MSITYSQTSSNSNNIQLNTDADGVQGTGGTDTPNPLGAGEEWTSESEDQYVYANPESTRLEEKYKTSPETNRNSSSLDFSKLIDASVKNYTTNFEFDKTPVFLSTEISEGDYIETSEELETYLRFSYREYTEVIVYNTKTDYRQKFERQDLINWYSTNLDIDDVPFHLLILQDGKIQICQDINKITNHTPVANHLDRSISIAFVGGYNNGYQDIDTCSPAQWKTFNKFMKVFYTIVPGGQAWGHSDINDTAYDPGFNVVSYVEKAFGSRNTLTIKQAKSLGAVSIETLINLSRARGFK